MLGKKWVECELHLLPTIFLPSNFLREPEELECKGTAASCEMKRLVWLHRVATSSKGRSSSGQRIERLALSAYFV